VDGWASGRVDEWMGKAKFTYPSTRLLIYPPTHLPTHPLTRINDRSDKQQRARVAIANGG
jgi:hypothetical protein